MKRSPFLILLLCLTPLEGQNNGIDQTSEIATAPTGETLFRWYGKVGRSYFIQVSDSANHLGKWNWAPLIESGNDEIISHDVTGTAATAFFRLKHTDQPLDPGKTLETSDFDSDGLSNIDEVIPPVATIGGPTDPLNADTDGDGLSDSFERAHGLDPNDDGSIDPENGPAGDPDGDGLTNAAEFALGTDPSNPDSDEDGLTDGEEVILTTDPNNANTDGDMFEGSPLKDGEDADPNEILVNWKKSPESSYLLIDLEVPAEGDYAVDLNDKGEVLFGTGIWAGGSWIPKIAPEITGVYPGSVSETYPDGVGYRVGFGDWDFFNNDRQLLQKGYVQPTEGPGVDGSLPCPVFWPAGQSSASFIYETADLWDDLYWYNWPVGVSTAGDMIVRTRPLQPPSGTTEITERMDRFDSSGVLVGSMDGTDGFHPSGQGFRGEITASGWVVSVLSRTATATVTAAHKVGLWDSSNTPVALPVEADGLGHLVTVSDIPNEKVVMVSGQWTESGFNGKIFLPNAAGAYQHVPSLSSHRIQRFAGDGTAITGPHEITRDGQTIQMHQLWRNGKLIPLRDLCPRFGELEDAGCQFFPLKANKNGTYLIGAEDANGLKLPSKLLQPLVFKLRNTSNDDYAKGWDNTNPDKTKGPWTSCGVNRKKEDGTTAWPNSLIAVTIPGCTAELGNLLELAQAPVNGGTEYVTLTNHTINGEHTLFDIQGTLATPATGCQIIVREKANPANRSGPLNVHVLPPRVVKFQVYRASHSATHEPGFVASVAQIKTELNTTYNEQANIRFQEIGAEFVSVIKIAGVFDAQGNIRVSDRQLLVNRINEEASAAHLKIILVKNLIKDQAIGSDIVGVADYQQDWVIVEAGLSEMDPYSHETGHSLDITTNRLSPPDGTKHEPSSLKAPNGGPPLMRHSVKGNTRWIKQLDWRTANIQAADLRYGN